MKRILLSIATLFISISLFAQQPYKRFPESFEKPGLEDKGKYARADVRLVSGNWTMDQSILANTAGRDRISTGKQSVRFQQNLKYPAYLQMNFDLKDGASKVIVSYGSYYNDPSSTWRLEYSIDRGVSWKQIGEDITDAGPNIQQATFDMDIKEPVRFRINKLGLGVTKMPGIANGRLSIDDFAVFPNK